MKPGEKVMLGHRMRQLRQSVGLNQTEMAAEIGISASYLNLIEHNQRPVTASLLLRLGETFDIDLKAFAADDSARLVAELSDAFADPVLAGTSITRRELQDFVRVSPVAAEAMSRLYDAYRQIRDEVREIADVNLKKVVAPTERVRTALEEAGNHFPVLEDAADQLWKQAKLEREDLYGGLVRHLETKHGLQVRVLPQDVMGTRLRRHDRHRGRILLSEALRREQRSFQLAFQIAFLQQAEVIDDLLATINLPDEEANRLLKKALGSYFAGAVMMPYSAFVASAREFRHDLDLLGRRFGASFEQVCHRLTTLNRSGERGISFFFIRVDQAGNVSKRLSSGSMQFGRYGGGCPKWIVHDAFRQSGRIITQAAELEDGQQVFTIARMVEAGWAAPGPNAPVFVVALGCDLRAAKDICYADHIDIARPRGLVEIGLSCASCERWDCMHRAFPPLGHKQQFDPSIRRAGLFEIE